MNKIYKAFLFSLAIPAILFAQVIISPTSGGTTTVIPSTPDQSSFLTSGGQITWIEDYVFTVSAATYWIGGTQYSAPQTEITLDAADPTNDRIDSIAVTSSNTIVKVTGTAAAQPSEPDIDPGNQLKLGIILVTANTTEPEGVSITTLYANNAGSPTEWDWTTSGSGFNVNSTNSPKPPSTHSIEGTAVANEAYAQGQIGSGTFDVTNARLLTLWIKSKATWQNKRGLQITLRSSGVTQGVAITINRTGSYGFTSSNTTDYQLVSIPITDFAIPTGTTINQIRISDFGGSIGFYIDDVSFQVAGATQFSPGITQEQADARYAPLGSGGGAWTLLDTDVSTAANEIILTGFSATYNTYVLTLDRVCVGTTTDSFLHSQVSEDGGSTWISDAVYYGFMRWSNQNGATGATTGTVATPVTSWKMHQDGNTRSTQCDAGWGFNAEMWFFAFNGSNNKMMKGGATWVDNNNLFQIIHWNYGYGDTTVFNAIKFYYLANDTTPAVTSGTGRLYGVQTTP